jgi:carbon-monoxide dehydrogenase large subunit
MNAGIGAAVARVEDQRLLTGRGRYTDDFTYPNQAYAVILRASVPHAKIASIDCDDARAMPGVLGIFTGKDVVEDGLGPSPCMIAMLHPLKKGNGDTMAVPTRLALAVDKVAFVGDPVAMVVADSRAEALDAAEAILVDYEDLPAVTGVAEAAAAGAPQVWDDALGNECFTVSMGDHDAVNAAFDAADHVVSASYPVTRVYAAPMEPRAVVANYDPITERYTVITGNQSPHRTRRTLAEIVLKVPETQVHVISPDMGGGFGMRSTIYPEMMLCPWASKKLGRPVKWVADRSEAFLADDHGRDSHYSIDLALSKDGDFQAIRVSNISAMGAYLTPVGPVVAFGFLPGVAGLYKTPKIAAKAVGYFTNAPPTSPYRGAGRPESILAIETVIDKAARQLGMDKIELRRRNLIPAEAMPFKTGLSYVYDCGDFPAIMDAAVKAGDVAGFAARKAESESRGKLRGLGVVNAIEAAGGIMMEGADLRFDAAGTATLSVGTHSHGQGHETVYKQMLAEKLGLDMDKIAFVQGDTDRIPLGGGTFGSRSMMMGGAAVTIAADRIIEKGKKIAAHKLEAAEGDIEFKNGVFTVAGTDKAMPLKAIAGLSHAPGQMPEGVDNGLAAFATWDSQAPTYPNGCHVCEVEIDPETGKVDLVRYALADDVGTVINPLLLKGQMHGGVAQGVGQVLSEIIAFDPDSGQMTTGSFMDYGMPRADDMPDVEVVSSPVPTANNPLGAKGAGEAGTVGALSCVMAAINDALAPLGIEDFTMPATPDRVWRAISQARGS